jgi:DNA (cytosine-5)-methyltransferase 1
MRVGSLFSGIGGIDLGLERAGMEVVWQCEIDSYCRKVLAKHWPDVHCYEDVRTLDDTTPKVDIICGGFPCQPVSHAGRRKGMQDDRWLWPEFVRVIRAVRPRWVLAENVPGLLSIETGRLFGGVLRDLAESGYDAEWDCIPAAALGAPHIRERVFLIAHTDSDRDAARQQEHTPARQSTRLGADGDVAHARYGFRAPWAKGRAHESEGASRDASRRGEALANAAAERLEGPQLFGQRLSEQRGPEHQGWWATEPDVGRVAHGVPARVDRLRGLGNAVVPQVAEYVGRMIMEADASRRVR